MTYYNRIGIVRFYKNLPYQYFVYSNRKEQQLSYLKK